MGDDVGNSFLGTGWAFPPRFQREGRLAMVSDEQDISQSIHIILSTTPGERVMHPTFGCGLQALVFEGIDEGVKTRIKDLVLRAIVLFEPRVEVDLVAVHTDALDEALLKVELGYRIRATNTAANMVFPFYIGSAHGALVGAAP